MIKNIRYIVAISLLVNIFISTLGINVFTHTCSSMQITDIAINLDNDSHLACSNCSTNIEETCCSVEADLHSSCEADSDDSNQVLSEKTCCSNDSEFIKLTFDSEYSINKVLSKISLPVIDFLANDIYELTFIFRINYYDFKSGVSPPYSSEYIHFICSLLE